MTAVYVESGLVIDRRSNQSLGKALQKWSFLK